MTQSINVLHILIDDHAETDLFIGLVTRLKKNGFKQFFCYLRGDKPINSRLMELGFQPHYIGESKKRLKKFKLSVAQKIKALLTDWGIDIIHAQRHKPTVYGTIAAHLNPNNVRMVTTVHGKDRSRTLQRKLFNLYLFSRISKVITVSKAIRDDVIKSNWHVNEKAIQCIYNGIDIKRFDPAEATPSPLMPSPWKENKFSIINVGRLTPVKGQSILLEAFYSFHKAHPLTQLIIAGKGKEEEALIKKSGELGLSDSVIFAGFSSNIKSLLSIADVFVLSSLSEGHPLSLLEAMAMKRPSVATRVGGIPEVIQANENGVLVDPNDPKQISQAFEYIYLKTQSDRKRMGEKARITVEEKFTLDLMALEIGSLYRKVCNT